MSSETYSYDGAGNIKAIGSAWFAYDKVSRLVSATLYDGPTGGGNQKQQSYTFDPFGNLTNIAGSPGRSIPTSAQANRLNGSGSSYDAAGNLKTWNGAVYEYDRFNQTSRMTSGGEDWIYLYTPDDERIWSYKADGTLSRWTLRDLEGKVLREYQNKSGVWRLGTDYIYRDGSLLAAETPTGRRHFYLDHLGTPRLITRGSGYQAAYHVYYPFGEELTAFNQDAEKMKFTGHERDLNSPVGAGDDLDYMHQRFCSPLTGRFLSTDIAEGRASRPQSWNRYAYAIGNPIRYIDPDGTDILDAVAGFGNALSSNFFLGIGRQESSNQDFVAGQTLGDLASLLLGTYESLEGGKLFIGGALCTAGTTGGCSPAGVPAMALGGALAIHGVTVISNAANNLGKGISLQLNDGPGSSGGNLTALSKNEVKKLGIDAEAFKQEIVGKSSVSKFNIATDKKGNIYLVAVQKGKGVAIETGFTMKQLVQFFPKK